MSEPQSSDLRVGDAEREEALRALGDHMSAGRLDITEYGDRTAMVATSKTRGDLLVLFTDLPEPKPRFGSPVKAAAPPPPQPRPVPVAGPPSVERWQGRPLGQRIYGALVPVAFLGALFLFFWTHAWFVFLLPVAFTIVGGSLFGDSWSHDRRAWERNRNRRNRRRY